MINRLMQRHHSLISFSTLLHNTVALLEHNFFNLLIAIALPLAISYVIYWTTLAVVVSQFNAAESWTQIQALFSWENNTTYITIGAVLIIAVLNILGLIAGPLVTIYQQKITWRQVFPKALGYVWSYIGLLLLIGFILLGVLVLSYIISAAIMTIVGLVNQNWITIAYQVLIPYIPNVVLAISAFFFTFAPYILIEQDTSAWQALIMSAQLVKQHFIGVVLRYVLVLLILSLLAFALQFIPLVGYALSLLVTTVMLTAYTYSLYYGVRYSE